MFQRLANSTWDEIIPVLGLISATIAFLLIILKAFLMKKDRVDHMSNLPLQDDEDSAKNPTPKKRS